MTKEELIIQEELAKFGGKLPTDTKQATDIMYAVAAKMGNEYSRLLEDEGISEEEILQMVGG